MKKLPSINQLNREYAALAAERKTLYGDYHRQKDLSRELSVARVNSERILGIGKYESERTAERIQKRNYSHEL